MKIALAQQNPIVGDIEGNLKKALSVLFHNGDSADLVIFPELFITGYPPLDLLEQELFIKKASQAVQKLIEASKNISAGIIIGLPLKNSRKVGRGLYNSALLICKGKVILQHNKSLLPTYDVFDESRYFDSALSCQVASFKKEVLGISICEEMWNDPELWKKRAYSTDPIESLAKQGATLIINISASPFYAGKEEMRYKIVRSHAIKHKLPFVFVNQVGGNDELIFDGRSFYLNAEGEPIAVLPSFKERVLIVDTKKDKAKFSYSPQNEVESVYKALVLGVKDYLRKCGFKKAVIGLSGGIDSALTCAIAKTALGSKNVFTVSLPSPYSSKESEAYARKLARNLGVSFMVMPITPIYNAYLESLGVKSRDAVTVSEENIQARIRGNILMAFSNRYGYLVLSTGNKSELAMGYCTLYGDLAGGLAVLSDVPKTMVYQLADLINKKQEIIPKEIISRFPTAELRPNQKDQDILPPYEVLDRIIELYINKGRSVKDIIAQSFCDPETIRNVISAINRNEFKMRQAPPGLKVTTKAFGIGRRMPIAAKF